MKPKREFGDDLQDIFETMAKMRRFVEDMSFEQVVEDDKTSFAVVRALEIIGEATKHIPSSVRRKYPKVPWTRMAGMRDRLIHGYLGSDLEIVWETATRLIPELKPQIAHVLEVENPKGEAEVDDKESL